jgi:hypothetical protein
MPSYMMIAKLPKLNPNKITLETNAEAFHFLGQ